MRSVASRQWRPIKGGPYVVTLYMNIVNYIRFGQDPRKGSQHQSRRKAEDAEKDQEATQDAPPPISSVVTVAIDAPDCTTEDWLQQRACRVK